MKKTVVKIFKFLIFLTLGISIFWYNYRNIDLKELISVLKNEVNYYWVFVSLFIGLISHISRTIRWRIMIEPIGHKPKFVNTFIAVMIGYLMNYTIPRAGEISRCGVLWRYEKISFTKSFGTVVAERLIDMISLLILLFIVFFIEFGQMLNFVKQNLELKEKLIGIISSPLLYIAIISILVLVIIFKTNIKKTSLFKRIILLLQNFKEGFISIRLIKQKRWFWFHSVFIWLCYYLMLYAIFFAFDFTKNLSPIAALTTFVFGSFGMAAPVQGGIGTYHILVTEALVLYGVDGIDGKIFAFVAHTSMTVMIIAIGLISMLVLPFINRRDDVEKTETV